MTNGDDREDAATWDEFRDVVNMTPKKLGSWLDTDESKEVGQKEGGSESVGHRSGRHIIRIDLDPLLPL